MSSSNPSNSPMQDEHTITKSHRVLGSFALMVTSSQTVTFALFSTHTTFLKSKKKYGSI